MWKLIIAKTPSKSNNDASPCPPTKTKTLYMLKWKCHQSFCDVSDKSWSTFILTHKKGCFIVVFMEIPCYLSIIRVSPCSCWLWNLLESSVFLHSMNTFFSSPPPAPQTCSTFNIASIFFLFFLSFPLLLRTEVETPGDSNTHLIGSLS